MKQQLFGTDGIRGEANHWPITPEIALKVGMAVGLVFKNGQHRHRVVIGKDTRLSGYMIESALIAGFTSVGVDVFQLTTMPTPGVAMLTRSLRADLGVMISASHNPYRDNGIKIFGPDGFKLSDEIESRVELFVESDLTSKLSESASLGKTTRVEGVHERYIEYAKRTMPRDFDLSELKIVVDCANGATYRVAPVALWELGADVVKLGVEPDGFNINKDCGSTSIDALCRKVKEVSADIGIALDGDGDRVIIVDEKGKVVDGDQIMAVVAQFWKEKERLKKPGIVTTIMSNLGLENFLEGIGLSMERTKVGDRYVAECMRREGYNFGGEQSGHLIMSDFTTTGDGLVAALQVLGMVKELDKPVSAVCSRFDPVPQIQKNVSCFNGNPLKSSQVRKAIKEAKNRIGKDGRLIVRPSGTEPVIRIMGEGTDQVLVEEVVNDVCQVVKEVAA